MFTDDKPVSLWLVGESETSTTGEFWGGACHQDREKKHCLPTRFSSILYFEHELPGAMKVLCIF